MTGTRDDVEVVERETVFQGYFRMDRYRVRHRLFAGGWSDVITREVLERGHAVSLLPYDPERDEVVLIEQFRAGALAAGTDPWLLECVAGIIESGEQSEDVARRECIEESGLRVTGLLRIGRMLVSPGAVSESIEMFVGRVDTTDAGGIHGLAHEHEDIRVSVHGIPEIRGMLDGGRIVVSHTIAALQWLLLNRDSVRSAWLGPA
jgi:ADP-ribose pyrophosphatase